MLKRERIKGCKSSDDIEVRIEVNDLGEVDLRLNERGLKMPERLLPDGTLRLLGLLAL